MGIRRRHHFVLVGADDAEPGLAVREIAGLERREPVAVGVGELGAIEP